MTVDHIRVAALLYGLCMAALWPTDPLVLPADALDAFHLLRMGQVSLCVVGWAAAVVLGQRMAPAVAVAMLLATAGLTAACVAPLGGLDEPWFYAGYVLPFSTTAALIPALPRIALMIAQIGVWYGAYLALQPQMLGHPWLGITLAVTAVASISAFALGHGIYHLMRNGFYQRLELAEQRARLASFNDTLAARVNEQTSALHKLASHIEQAHEDERRRIARDLHDDTGQALTAMRLQLQLARMRLGGAPREPFDALDQGLDRVFETIRRVLDDLRPKALDDLGLAAAVAWQVRRFEAQHGTPVALEVEPADLKLPDALSTTVFRMLQEALTNVARHAQADGVRVRLFLEDGVLGLVVADDGVGFEEGSGGGMGLLGMRERATALGGSLEVASRCGAGTSLCIRLPATPVVP